MSRAGAFGHLPYFGAQGQASVDGAGSGHGIGGGSVSINAGLPLSNIPGDNPQANSQTSSARSATRELAGIFRGLPGDTGM